MTRSSREKPTTLKSQALRHKIRKVLKALKIWRSQHTICIRGKKSRLKHIAILLSINGLSSCASQAPALTETLPVMQIWYSELHHQQTQHLHPTPPPRRIHVSVPIR